MSKLGIYIEVWRLIIIMELHSRYVHNFIPLVIGGGTVEEFEVVTSTLFFKFLI